MYFVSFSFVKDWKSGCTFGGFVGRLTEAVLFFRGYAIFLFIEDEMHVSKFTACFVAFNCCCHLAKFYCEVLTVRMVGSLLIRGISYPSRVALTAKEICALALVLDIVGCLNYL